MTNKYRILLAGAALAALVSGVSAAKPTPNTVSAALIGATAGLESSIFVETLALEDSTQTGVTEPVLEPGGPLEPGDVFTLPPVRPPFRPPIRTPFAP